MSFSFRILTNVFMIIGPIDILSLPPIIITLMRAFPCQERQRDPSLDNPDAVAQAIFHRPVRDGRFFGWAHSALITEKNSYTLKECDIILQEAAASEDPPRWV